MVKRKTYKDKHLIAVLFALGFLVLGFALGSVAGAYQATKEVAFDQQECIENIEEITTACLTLSYSNFRMSEKLINDSFADRYGEGFNVLSYCGADFRDCLVKV